MKTFLIRLRRKNDSTREKIVSTIDPRPAYVRHAYASDLKDNAEKVLQAQSLDIEVLYSLDKRQKDYYRSFLGNYVMHTWIEAFTVEVIFNAFPDIKQVIELGTGSGGFTLFMAIHMQMLGGETYTFDIDHNKMPDQTRRLLRALKVKAQIGDVFSESIKGQIKQLLSRHKRTLLVCDNGNKEREFNLYAPLMKEGDLILLDDWKTEVCLADIRKTMTEYSIEIVYPQLFDGFTNHILLMKQESQ